MQGMIGVIVNTAAVIIGSMIGLVFRKGIPEKLSDAVMIGIGLCTLYIGISGALAGRNAIAMILAMVLGAVTGTLLDLDGKLNRLGEWVGKSTSSSSGAAAVAQGFVTASLLFCIGAMTITGSLTAGLTGDNSTIFTKSLLDLVSSIMLSASLGIGVMCSAVFVFVFQGAIVMLAQYIEPLLIGGAKDELICVGSLLIIALGLNLIGISKIKTANYLPAIFFAPFTSYLAALIPFLS